MSERYSVPLEYIRLAKRGTFQNLGEYVKVLRRFVWNSQNCDFHARTDGAYYLATGQNTQRVILVSPDGALNYTAMAAMSINAALTYIIGICSSPGIPGWDEFAGWFDGMMQRYGNNLLSAIQSVTVGSLTTTTIPTYTTGGTGAENFFQWVRTALVAAETDAGVTLQMSDYADGSKCFKLPVSFTAEVIEEGVPTTVTVNMLIEMRE